MRWNFQRTAKKLRGRTDWYISTRLELEDFCKYHWNFLRSIVMQHTEECRGFLIYIAPSESSGGISDEPVRWHHDLEPVTHRGFSTTKYKGRDVWLWPSTHAGCNIILVLEKLSDLSIISNNNWVLSVVWNHCHACSPLFYLLSAKSATIIDFRSTHVHKAITFSIYWNYSIYMRIGTAVFPCVLVWWLFNCTNCDFVDVLSQNRNLKMQANRCM